MRILNRLIRNSYAAVADEAITGRQSATSLGVMPQPGSPEDRSDDISPQGLHPSGFSVSLTTVTIIEMLGGVEDSRGGGPEAKTGPYVSWKAQAAEPRHATRRGRVNKAPAPLRGQKPAIPLLPSARSAQDGARPATRVRLASPRARLR